MRKKNRLFKIIPFLLLWIRIRTLKLDPDLVKSRPDPQHWMWDRKCDTGNMIQESWNKGKWRGTGGMGRRCETGGVKQETEDVRQDMWDRRHGTGGVGLEAWERGVRHEAWNKRQEKENRYIYSSKKVVSENFWQIWLNCTNFWCSKLFSLKFGVVVSVLEPSFFLGGSGSRNFVAGAGSVSW